MGGPTGGPGEACHKDCSDAHRPTSACNTTHIIAKRHTQPVMGTLQVSPRSMSVRYLVSGEGHAKGTTVITMEGAMSS